MDRGGYLRRGIFVVLSFVLSLLFTVTACLAVLQLTVFDKNFFRRQIGQSMYAENLMENLQEILVSYGESSGFEEAVFREAVTMDMLRADVYREVSSLYEDTERKIDAGLFFNRMYQSLIEDAEKRGYILTDEDKEAVIYLARVTTEAYIDIVSLPFTEQIFSILGKLQRINSMGLIGIVVLDLFCIVLLLICLPSRRKKMEGIMHATAGSFLLMCVPALFLTFSDSLKRVPLTGKALYILSQKYIQGIVQTNLMILQVELFQNYI